MKKILISLSMIAAVAAIVVGATGAFLSNTETSGINTFSVGTIDISVDDQNPWTSSWSNYLDKPSQTNYMNFVIKNVGENPAKVWKKITNVVNGPGEDPGGQVGYYCTCGGSNVWVSSEPECYEGTNECTTVYEERDNLSAFMIYDMAICVVAESVATTTCPFINDGHGNIVKPDLSQTSYWQVIVNENDQVRVDNVIDTWVKLSDGLAPGAKIVVSQSYHLMTWDDSGQPVITNWAQGDTMSFTVELDARQTDAPAPGTTQQNGDIVATINLVERDPTTWDIIPGVGGTLTYNVAASTFMYDLNVTTFDDTEYCLVYYADPWPGDGPLHGAGALLGKHTAVSNAINETNQDSTLAADLPMSDDNNAAVGAKVWLIPCDDYSTDIIGAQGNLNAWNPTQYLFDDGLVNFDATP